MVGFRDPGGIFQPEPSLRILCHPGAVPALHNPLEGIFRKFPDSLYPQAPDEAALAALAQTLRQHRIDHRVWTEHPEDIPTCLALRPYPKDQVHQHLKGLKLLK
ncbi:putative peptidyl-tRNA hydrolase PTRHD1 [Corapipo altera]|uniref:putative peptidyl-tRNA hydrolase PTRHD1 n=1 Tax=Corapipo altera TaxID=415028 RepID=UPI000FD67A24|nr:putative peptidyl-tRNA hydrolase PTRHD1 [Corapipo altera]